MYRLANGPCPVLHRGLADRDVVIIIHVLKCCVELLALFLKAENTQAPQDARNAEMIVIHRDAPIGGSFPEIGTTCNLESVHGMPCISHVRKICRKRCTRLRAARLLLRVVGRGSGTCDGRQLERRVRIRRCGLLNLCRQGILRVVRTTIWNQEGRGFKTIECQDAYESTAQGLSQKVIGTESFQRFAGDQWGVVADLGGFRKRKHDLDVCEVSALVLHETRLKGPQDNSQSWQYSSSSSPATCVSMALKGN